MCRPVTDEIALFILALFGLLMLVLSQFREIMRQIARTADEWRHMIEALRNARRKRRSVPRHRGLTDAKSGRSSIDRR
jgi:hypothetical protein